MINFARRYLNSGNDGKRYIMWYYNEKCYPFVPDNRKYKIQFNDDWCAAFVSAIAHMSGLRSEFPFEVSTYYMKARMVNNGDFFRNNDDALDNDIVFFDWNGSGTPQHVGIVVSLHDGFLETIEGNKSDEVAFRKIPWDSPFILGYGRTPVPIDREDSVTIEYMARAALRGQYGDGDVRKRILGDDYSIVQRRVNEIIRSRTEQ